MTYRGQVKNGVVVLEGNPALPEGTLVAVEPVVDPADLKSLQEGLLKFSGVVKGMPSDMAANHDHYIHGAPRK